MKRLLIALCSVAVLGAIPARAVAAPIVDGFWNPQNGDGYFGDKNNSTPCCMFNSYDFGGSVNATGAMGFYNDGAGHLYIMFTQPLGIVDNSYGTGSVGWGGKEHTFKALTNSDHAEIVITDAKGNTVWESHIDYLTESPKDSNKYVSLGNTGGDGKQVTGDATALMAYATSLQWNLAHSCYAKDPTTYAGLVDTGSGKSLVDGNSPNTGSATQPALSPNPGSGNDGYGNILNPCPAGKTSDAVAGYGTPVNWLFHVVYEIEIDLSKITGGINGIFDVTVVHDSPFKSDTAVPCDDCGVNPLTTVPEPGSLLLLGTGALGLVGVLRNRRKRQA